MEKTLMNKAVAEMLKPHKQPQREQPQRSFRSVAGGAGVSVPTLREIPAAPKEPDDE